MGRTRRRFRAVPKWQLTLHDLNFNPNRVITHPHTNGPTFWGPDHWHPRAYRTQTLRARRRCISSHFPLASGESGSTYGCGQPGTPTSPTGAVRRLRRGSNIDSEPFLPEGALLSHTQHHDRPSYALLAFCPSIITLVARRGLIDGLGSCGPPGRVRPWHLRLAAHRCRDGVPRTARALNPRCRG